MKITEQQKQILEDAMKNMTFEEKMEMYHQAQKAIAIKKKFKLIEKLKQNNNIRKAMLEVEKNIDFEYGNWSLLEDKDIIKFEDGSNCCGIVGVNSLIKLIIKYFESFSGENKYRLPDFVFDKLVTQDFLDLGSYIDVSITCSKDNAYKLIHDQILFENYMTEDRGAYHRFVTVNGVKYVVYKSCVSTAKLLKIHFEQHRI